MLLCIITELLYMKTKIDMLTIKVDKLFKAVNRLIKNQKEQRSQNFNIDTSKYKVYN